MRWLGSVCAAFLVSASIGWSETIFVHDDILMTNGARVGLGKSHWESSGTTTFQPNVATGSLSRAGYCPDTGNSLLTSTNATNSAANVGLLHRLVVENPTQACYASFLINVVNTNWVAVTGTYCSLAQFALSEYNALLIKPTNTGYILGWAGRAVLGGPYEDVVWSTHQLSLSNTYQVIFGSVSNSTAGNFPTANVWVDNQRIITNAMWNGRATNAQDKLRFHSWVGVEARIDGIRVATRPSDFTGYMAYARTALGVAGTNSLLSIGDRTIVQANYMTQLVPLVWYRFNDGYTLTGLGVAVNSGRGGPEYNGTLIATLTNANTFDAATKSMNFGIATNQYNTYISMSSNKSWFYSSNWTVTFWSKDWARYSAVLSDQPNSALSLYNNFRLYADATPRSFPMLNVNNGTNVYVPLATSSFSNNPSENIMCTFSYSNGICTVYTNGLQMARSSTFALGNLTNGFNLGRWYETQLYNYNGYLDSFAIYTPALSSNHVYQLFLKGARL